MEDPRSHVREGLDRTVQHAGHPHPEDQAPGTDSAVGGVSVETVVDADHTHS